MKKSKVILIILLVIIIIVLVLLKMYGLQHLVIIMERIMHLLHISAASHFEIV
jgi:hypothetical protein